jgi:hypothetical protein
VRLRNSDKPFGLSGLGTMVVVIALYAVGLRLAFLIDVGLFPERPTVRHHAIDAGRLGGAELSTHGVRGLPEALVLPTRRRSA